MSRSERGFTLIELACVVLILGLVAAFAIPGLRRMHQTQNVIGARDNIIAQLQLARTKAISTGTDMKVNFFYNSLSSTADYYVVIPGAGTSAYPKWKLPKGVTYQWPVGSPMSVTMTKDGKANASFMIPLTNTLGLKDTVSVLTSGLVMRQ